MTKAKFFFVSLCTLFTLVGHTIRSQNIDLETIDQLEDKANSGRIFSIKKNFDLKGTTLNIVPGITIDPQGGYFYNGTIGSIDFRIQIREKNKLFDHTINFETPYTQPFLVEWFGAKGDSTTDDSQAFRKSVQSATRIVLAPRATYYLKNPIPTNRTGKLTIEGNNARITAFGFPLEPILDFGPRFSQVTLKNIHIDGQRKNAQAISIKSSFTGSGLYIHHMQAPQKTSFGIRATIAKTAVVIIQDCVIEHIRAPKLGNINNKKGIGIARAIQVEWMGLFPNSEVRITNNKLRHVVADDGDVIQIAQMKKAYSTSNKTIISGNDIAFGTRRLVKASASGIELYNNRFETFPSGHLDSELNPKNKTYMVAFQRYFDVNGREEDFVLGSVVEDNVFISDSKMQYGNGGSLGFQQTKGARIRNNTFVNSQIVFRNFNQGSLLSDNTFTNTNIIFPENAQVFNKFSIKNNKNGSMDSRTFERATDIKGIIGFDANCTLSNLNIENNHFNLFDTKENTIKFLMLDPGSRIDSLKITENTLNKIALDTTTTYPAFISTSSAFGINSEVRNNKVVSTINMPYYGLRFINVPSLPASHYSSNVLDIPNTKDCKDPRFAPNSGTPKPSERPCLDRNPEP